MSRHQNSLGVESERTDAGREQNLRREWRQGKKQFPYSAEHDQDRQPTTVPDYIQLADGYTYIHIIHRVLLPVLRSNNLTIRTD